MDNLEETWFETLSSTEQKAFLKGKHKLSAAERREKNRIRQAKYRAQLKSQPKLEPKKRGRPAFRTFRKKLQLRREYMRRYRAKKLNIEHIA